MKESYEPFFARINALDTGSRAALKRNAGVALAEADSRAVTAFYRCLPQFVDQWEEDRWFAAACLRCLWDAGQEGERTVQEIFAGLIRSESVSESLTHRIEALLDTPWDADGFLMAKLSRLIKLLRQKSGELPEFGSLISDLTYWNSDSQRVQREWARVIFAAENDKKASEN